MDRVGAIFFLLFRHRFGSVGSSFSCIGNPLRALLLGIQRGKARPMFEGFTQFISG
jgi:hypothetical protein